MTEDRLPDATALDDLASALLDGEATAAEEARRAEPAVRQRVDAFAAVAGLVGEPPAPPGDADREQAIAAALAAFDAGPAGRAGHPADEVAARRDRRGAPRWLPAVAAAGVAVLGLGGVLAAFGDGGDDAEVAATLEESAENAGEGAATALESGYSDAAAPAGGGEDARDQESAGVDVPPAVAGGALGAFPTLDALLVAAEAGAAEAFPEEPAGGGSGGNGEPGAGNGTDDAGAGATECVPPDGTVAYTAALAGRAVLVWADAASITVLDATTCELVAPPHDR